MPRAQNTKIIGVDVERRRQEQVRAGFLSARWAYEGKCHVDYHAGAEPLQQEESHRGGSLPL